MSVKKEFLLSAEFLAQFTKTERGVVIQLAQGPATLEQLHGALYGDQLRCSSAARTMVSLARKRLRSLGYDIRQQHTYVIVKS